MFVDQVIVHVYAGTGGSGAEAFRREKFVPRGGPSGGDGGRGGDIILEADGQLSTLLDYRYQQHYRAERGEHGQGKNRTGKDGADLTLRVPPGTVAYDDETGVELGELLEDGDRLVVAEGGRGGRGNAAFATATNRAPREWEPGEPGEERRLRLELKLFADVGLVGKPNAGKSTLLSVISAARPKIAAYPFTTLEPNLGVVELSEARTFVVADIPGIIEGAHEGKGLGLKFLRHIERTRALVFMIPVDAEDATAEYRALRAELASYSDELARRPHCILLAKSDILAPDEGPPAVDAPDARDIFTVSAVTRDGLDDFLEALWAWVREVEAGETEQDEEPWRP